MDLTKIIAGLTWEPRIGENFKTSTSSRILLIGESHYHDGAKDDVMNDLNFTKHVVNRALEGNLKKTRFYSNTELALIGSSNYTPKKFWENVAFYNFIQRPMKNAKDRPNEKDYQNAAGVFYHVMDELRPTVCIFLGMSAAKFIRAYSWENKKEEFNGWRFENSKVDKYNKISLVYKSKYPTAIFIKHPSAYFSYEGWHQFITQLAPDDIKWLQENSK